MKQSFQNKFILLFFFSLFAFVVSGCGCVPKPAPAFPSTQDLPKEDAVEDTFSLDDEEFIEEDDKVVQVVSLESTDLMGPAPLLNLGKKSSLKKLKLELKNWELSLPPGKHVHLIIDNQDYIAIRDVSEPIDVINLYEENFSEPLAKGKHVIRAFPSRSHHESVKEGSPFVVAVLSNGKSNDENPIDLKSPLLTYSRPKGCNIEGQDVLLDFYLHNVVLSNEGFQVKYIIDGEVEGVITQWKPHTIQGLSEGTHAIVLQLVDAQGNVVPGVFNNNQRTFEVKEMCE